MALEASGRRFCKAVHIESGRTVTRRIHTMMVQAADGRLHKVDGKNLPDSISLYSGVPYEGGHLAEVLLNPKKVKASLVLSTSGWISKRDVFYLVLGMFSWHVISRLAEATAHALM